MRPTSVVVRSRVLTCAYQAQKEAQASRAQIVSAGHNGREFWFEAEFNNEAEAMEFYERMRRA